MAGVRDRVAVVTGAANGLGREIALVLAREGARLALGDLAAGGLDHTAAAIKSAGGSTISVVGDLTEEEPAKRLIDTAVAEFGRLDILINDVGGSRNARIWEMTVEDWDFVLRLNLRSTFLCTRAAVPHMMRRRYGRIEIAEDEASAFPGQDLRDLAAETVGRSRHHRHAVLHAGHARPPRSDVRCSARNSSRILLFCALSP